MSAKVSRAHQRKRILWEAKLHQDGCIWHCAALDISPRGAKIQIDQPLGIDSKVVLAINRLGRFQGEVRWQNDSIAGILFLEDAGIVEERLRGMPRTKEM